MSFRARWKSKKFIPMEKYDDCPHRRRPAFRGGRSVQPGAVVSRHHSGIHPSKVLYIGKREMLKLFASDPDILLSYMENMSDRLIMLNRKIEILSLGSLRRQIAFELLKMADKQQTDTVTLPYSKRVWAEHLNVTRPSLSREIGSMRDQGIISFSGNRITLVDRRAVEEILD